MVYRKAHKVPRFPNALPQELVLQLSSGEGGLGKRQGRVYRIHHCNSLRSTSQPCDNNKRNNGTEKKMKLQTSLPVA